MVRGGREGAVCGEVAELRGGVAVGELWASNRGGGVVYCVRGGVAKLGGQTIACWANREGERGEGRNSPERGKTTALRELGSGEGRRVVVEAGARKKGLGASFL